MVKRNAGARLEDLNKQTELLNKQAEEFVADQAKRVLKTNDEYDALKKEAERLTSQLEEWHSKYDDVWKTDKLSWNEREEAASEYNSLVKQFNKLNDRREELVAMRRSL